MDRGIYRDIQGPILSGPHVYFTPFKIPTAQNTGNNWWWTSHWLGFHICIPWPHPSLSTASPIRWMTTSNKKKRYTTKSKKSAPISWHWHISWFIYMTFCFKHLSQLLDEISSIPSEVVGLQNQPVVSSPMLGTSRVSILRFENSRFDLRTPKIDCLVHQGCESRTSGKVCQVEWGKDVNPKKRSTKSPWKRTGWTPWKT